MSAKITIRCPNCREQLSLGDATAGSENACHACGFRFVMDDSVSTVKSQPRRVDRFELLELVGEGAFGVVWKARDVELNRIVALKVPRAHHVDRAQADAFLREARAAGQLRHPNIIPVHEVRHTGEQVFIVCDLIDGVTLSQWMDRARPTFAESARLVHCLALALQHAHERGIVHRDIKPSNILIDTSGTPFIGDFGLAKWADEGVTVTVEGQIIGTPAYMPPEQARGKGCFADARSDIYSLGVILYELLSGERPFRGSFTMIIQQVIHDDPPSLRHLNHRIPRDLETVCLKCLEKDPQRRYATAAELANDLGRFLGGESINARPVKMAEKIWRWYRRNATAAMITAGAVTIANSLVLIAWAIIGMGVCLLGFHPVAHRFQAAFELTALILFYYLPWLAVGFYTLNGSFRALCLGTALSVLSLLLTLLMIAGKCPLLALQTMQEARSDVYVRIQLSSLLMCIAGGVLLVNLIALVARYDQQQAAQDSSVGPGGR